MAQNINEKIEFITPEHTLYFGYSTTDPQKGRNVRFLIHL
jgi:hypothetical protein